MLKKSVVIIPIYRPDDKFKKLLAMLKQQKEVSFDVYIIDSGSCVEDYLNELDGLSYTIITTTPQNFNHGGTRQAAAEACKGYQYLIYMTQDAIPANEFTLHNLLTAFENPKVGCAPMGGSFRIKTLRFWLREQDILTTLRAVDLKVLLMLLNWGSKYLLFLILLQLIDRQLWKKSVVFRQMSSLVKIPM